MAFNVGDRVRYNHLSSPYRNYNGEEGTIISSHEFNANLFIVDWVRSDFPSCMNNLISRATYFHSDVLKKIEFSTRQYDPKQQVDSDDDI